MDYLEEIKKEMESIAGSYNGKDSGLAEDRAMWAREVIEITDELVKKLKERI